MSAETSPTAVPPDPPVFLGLTQPELDAQYDQATLVPNFRDHVALWRRKSDALRAGRAPVTHAYGPSPEEVLDLYPGRAGAPVHMHVHGGAWRAFSRAECGFPARGLGADGAHVAILDFGLAPKTRLPAIAGQIRRAAVWLLDRASSFGAAPGRVFVSGHSSGAHLAACLLDAGWQARAGLAPGAIAGAVLVSGLYDLVPVQLSARNDYLHLTDAEVAALSPVRHVGRDPIGFRVPVALLWGDGELPEFQRQSQAFAAALTHLDRLPLVEVLPDTNHFQIYDLFEDPEAPPTRVALDQMRAFR